MDFKITYDGYKKVVEDYFKVNFESLLGDNTLDRAILYAFSGGGKRIRPTLMVATADYLKVDYDKILHYALYLESVHIHSLIHDDLPALDNDTMRRGKPCVHIKFGDDIGVLAGDALLNMAYKNCLKFLSHPDDFKVLSYLSSCTDKMLHGQALDTRFTKDISSINNLNFEQLVEIYKNKTSALITAAILTPLIIAKRTDLIDDFTLLGEKLGLLFQITDDLIDFNANFEVESTEPNIVTLFGLNKAIQFKLDLQNECNKIADKYSDFTFIKLFIEYVTGRAF